MTVYRETEFTSPAPEKIAVACEVITDIVTKAGAEMIDIALLEDAKELVIARYTSETSMRAATTYNQEAFGALVSAGVVESGSIVSRSGKKIFSF